jgi:hypothetical protein
MENIYNLNGLYFFHVESSFYINTIVSKHEIFIMLLRIIFWFKLP